MASVSLGLEGVGEEDDYRSPLFQPEITPRRDGYLPTAEAVQEMVKRDALNARVQLVAQDCRRATYCIDQSIQVTVPSPEFREAMAKHWEGEESSRKVRAWSAVLLTIAGIAALFSPLPYIALASVITAIYAGVQFYRAGEAGNQVAGWRVDPSQELATERAKAYEKGFLYAYKKELKLGASSQRAVLLPHEVEHLYHRYFDRTCLELSMQRCTQDGQKKRWLDRFLADNPLSESVLLYAFGEVPQRFAPLSRNFERLAASLRNVEAEFTALRGQRTTEAERAIQRIESQRSAAVAIPQSALQYKLNEAREERDQRRQVGEGVDPRQIERDYQSQKEGYEAVCQAAIVPINLYFDGKVHEAREALQQVLSAICGEEAHAFSPYYNYAQRMIAAALATRNLGYVYTEEPFNPVREFHIPELPPIELDRS